MTIERHPASAATAGPPGISGKRLTLGVLVALVLIGVSLSYTLWTYNELDRARRTSVTAWRAVTEHLAQRYRTAEKMVAEGVDNRQLDMEFGEKFRLAIDAFRTTSLPEEQVNAAERLEQLLAAEDIAAKDIAAGGAELEPLPAAAEAEIESYNLAREREKELLESWGGRLLDVFLKFEVPRPFSVTPLDRSN